MILSSPETLINMCLISNHPGKITSWCEQFSLTQVITEPINYTETSSSLIDLVLVVIKHMLYEAVLVTYSYIKTYDITILFLEFLTSQNLNGSLLLGVYGATNRITNLLRENTDWVVDINTYAKDLLAGTCIPNKVVTIGQSDPPWITSHIKQLIRKRKSVYRKARRTGNLLDWHKFKQIRNTCISAIRDI